MTNTNNNEIRDTVSTALRAARMTASVKRSGLNIEHGSREVVVTGNTFPIKDILKAAGFRWSRPSKSWRFKTVSYLTLDMGAICRALAS